MVDLGMPTLIELPELENCAALCRELGLQFLEPNMDLPQYQVSAIDPTRFQAAAEAYGLYYTIHLSENMYSKNTRTAIFNSFASFGTSVKRPSVRRTLKSASKTQPATPLSSNRLLPCCWKATPLR